MKREQGGNVSPPLHALFLPLFFSSLKNLAESNKRAFPACFMTQQLPRIKPRGRTNWFVNEVGFKRKRAGAGGKKKEREMVEKERGKYLQDIMKQLANCIETADMALKPEKSLPRTRKLCRYRFPY